MGQVLSATKSIRETCRDIGQNITPDMCTISFDESNTTVTSFGNLTHKEFQANPDIAGKGVCITPCHPFHAGPSLFKERF